MRHGWVIGGVLLVASCSQAQPIVGDEMLSAEQVTSAPTAPAEARRGPTSANTAPAPTVTVPLLAYAYRYGLEAPAARIPGLVAKHEATCAAAGAAVCQMTGSNTRSAGRDKISATLTLRATPTWVAQFRANLSSQMSQAGGRVVDANVESEDLTRQIIDTEATIRAKTTLRDRLQTILATRPGKLSELLEIEQALATVQGEIDATQSELAVMRTRVQTSALTVQYDSLGALAPEGVGSPLARAVSDFLGIIVITLAAMVRIVAWVLPWALVAALVAWLFRKRIAALRNRKPVPLSSNPPSPTMDAPPAEG